MIKITQGFALRRSVSSLSSKLIVRGDDIKIVVDQIEEADGKIFLIASADATKTWQPRTV